MQESQLNPTERRRAEALWERWTAMWNGDEEIAREIIANGFRAHLTSNQRKLVDPEELRDPEAVMAWVPKVRAQYSDLRYLTNGAVLVDGDTLVARWFADGVYAGRSVAPSDVPGRRFRLAGIDVLRCDGDRICECWTLSGALDL